MGHVLCAGFRRMACVGISAQLITRQGIWRLFRCLILWWPLRYHKTISSKAAAARGVRVGRNPLYFGWENIAERPIKQFLSLIVPAEKYGKLTYQCDNVAPLDGANWVKTHPVRSHDPKHRASQLFLINKGVCQRYCLIKSGSIC